MEEEGLLFPVKEIGDCVRHIVREHNQETYRLANLKADCVKSAIVEKGGNVERWKEVKGFWARSNTNDGASGCGTVNKGVDRGTWIAISKVALPLETCSAMSAEVVGACILTDILNLLFPKQSVIEKMTGALTAASEDKIRNE